VIIDAMLPDTVDSADEGAFHESVGIRTTWTTETSRDAFVQLTSASERTTTIGLGTAVAVAFARNPMSMAVTANHLHQISGGRLLLGLGTQVQAHIERRFDMPWSHPAARMQEYVSALHAIWNCWNTGQALNFEGRFYRHTLMPPLFDPGPNPFGPPRVYLAGVGARMASAAGTVADGFLAPPLANAEYLRDVLLPAVSEGQSQSQRTVGRPEFQRCVMPLIATGLDAAETDAAIEATRTRLAFYASTPTYRELLRQYGWARVGEQLGDLARRGEWLAMPDLVTDTMLDEFAVVAAPSDVIGALRERYDALADRAILYPVEPWPRVLSTQILLPNTPLPGADPDGRTGGPPV